MSAGSVVVFRSKSNSAGVRLNGSVAWLAKSKETGASIPDGDLATVEQLLKLHQAGKIGQSGVRIGANYYTFGKLANSE